MRAATIRSGILVLAASAAIGCQGPAGTARAPVHAAADAGCVELGFSVFAGGPCACGDAATCVARCSQGSASDCANLGGCSMTGSFGAPDPAGYYRYSRRGCEIGDPMACTNLGDAYRKGVGTPVDPALAEAAFARALAAHRRGCDAGDSGACYLIGHAYREGQGVARDAAQARVLDEKSCALGGVMSCLLLASGEREAGRYEEAVKHDARVCELTCFCDPLLAASARGSPAAAAAIASFRERCSRGDAAACAAAAREEKAPAGLRPRRAGR